MVKEIFGSDDAIVKPSRFQKESSEVFYGILVQIRFVYLYFILLTNLALSACSCFLKTVPDDGVLEYVCFGYF